MMIYSSSGSLKDKGKCGPRSKHIILLGIGLHVLNYVYLLVDIWSELTYFLHNKTIRKFTTKYLPYTGRTGPNIRIFIILHVQTEILNFPTIYNKMFGNEATSDRIKAAYLYNTSCALTWGNTVYYWPRDFHIFQTSILITMKHKYYQTSFKCLTNIKTQKCRGIGNQRVRNTSPRHGNT